MISFDNVTKEYRTGTIALDKATFQVADNDFVFLVGPSGAGKTSILKMILRQIVPTSGIITVDGQTISDKKFKDTHLTSINIIRSSCIISVLFS